MDLVLTLTYLDILFCVASKADFLNSRISLVQLEKFVWNSSDSWQTWRIQILVYYKYHMEATLRYQVILPSFG